MEEAEVNRHIGLINSRDSLRFWAWLFLQTPAAGSWLSFTAADAWCVGPHRSSAVVAHQHAVEFFFLLGPVVAALGLGFLLLLFFVPVGGASFLLLACGSVGYVVVFGLVGGGKGWDGCNKGCDGKYADQCGFHESFSF
jgi:hypothetical protein